jgi:hypothetical protein
MTAYHVISSLSETARNFIGKEAKSKYKAGLIRNLAVSEQLLHIILSLKLEILIPLKSTI